MKRLTQATIAALISLLISSCDGGGGFAALTPGSGGGGGIGGSGITSSGEVTGFGSIFVNGIEFDTDSADILVNGEPASEDALGLGMVVTVEGTVNDDGHTGNAQRVIFNSAVRGPVASTSSSDSEDQRLLLVLDMIVVADRRSTVVAGTELDGIAVNDLIEVSGFTAADGRLWATRIERIDEFVPNESVVDTTGVVSDVADTTFALGDLIVDFSGADLSALPGGEVNTGEPVTVRGTLNDQRVTASEVLPDSNLRDTLAVDEALALQGAVTDLEGENRFSVNGVPVDSRSATLDFPAQTLREGLLVQVAGTWDGQRLNADTVSSREGRVLVAAPIDTIDTETGTFTVNILDSAIEVLTTSITLIADAAGQTDRFSLNALRNGDYVIIEANSRGDSLPALRVTLSRPRDNALRGEVGDIETGVAITVLGFRVETANTALLDATGEPLTTRAFYERLREGDRVLVLDRVPTDGAADVVRLQEEAPSRSGDEQER